MRVYVIEWQTDNGYWMSHGISGIFLSRKDAVDALERTEFQCFRDVPNGMWKLSSNKKSAEYGIARPKTKDGEVWEIYGPDGCLVDGNGKDEPEYRITRYEVGRMDV